MIGGNTRFGRWLRASMPSRESLEHNRFIRPVAHRVLAPALWRFTRRSVPRGVALGLFVGLFVMIPGLQITGAALLALPFRLVGITFSAVFAFLQALLFLPARALGWRPRQPQAQTMRA